MIARMRATTKILAALLAITFISILVGIFISSRRFSDERPKTAATSLGESAEEIKLSEQDDLYRELKGDVELIAEPLIDFAQDQIRKRAAFLPFGATLDEKGEISLEAAATGAESASSTEVLPLLHEGLRAIAAKRDLREVAVCEWAKITVAGQLQTDAIKVLVEHRRGLAVALYIPCKRQLPRGWEFGEMIAKIAAAEVRPWANK
jgi:hypothetical protein